MVNPACHPKAPQSSLQEPVPTGHLVVVPAGEPHPAFQASFPMAPLISVPTAACSVMRCLKGRLRIVQFCVLTLLFTT